MSQSVDDPDRRSKDGPRILGTLLVLGALALLHTEALPVRQRQLATDLLQLGAAVWAAAACLAAGRRWSSAPRAFWTLLGLSCAIWGTGQGLWTLGQAVLGPARILTAWDILFLGSALPLFAALLVRPHLPRTTRFGFVLDASLLGVLGLHAFVYFALPHAVAGHQLPYAWWLNLLLNLKGVLVLAWLALLLREARPPWRETYERLAAAFVLFHAGSAISNLALVTGRYHPGFYDIPWTVPFLWIGLTALGAPEGAVAIPARDGDPDWSETRKGTVVALLAVVLVPALHLAVHGPPASGVLGRLRTDATLVTTALVGGLFVLRQLRVLRSVEETVAHREDAQGRVERALAEQEALLRTVVETAPECVALLAPDGTVLTMNRAGLNMMGAPDEGEVLGRCFEDFTAPAHRDALRALVQGVLGGGGTSLLEIEVVGLGGRRRSLEAQAAPLVDPIRGSQALLVVARDVTERRQLEERLRQSQKMEAVGRLAGGIAHDFNNLLNVIMGYGALMLRRLPADDGLQRHAQEVVKAAERAAGLTRQLLAFSRQQVLEPKIVDLGSRIEDMVGLLRRLVPEDIELATHVDPAAGRVLVDPGQIEQVILNLVINARDAMPRGGRLLLEVTDAQVAGGFRGGTDVRAGRYVLLAVSDTGVGMTEEVRRHVFEPFFTTKEKGKGTGLGLATVYGIVKQSEGYVWVFSEPEKGTTFEVYLPVVEGRAEPAVPEPPRSRSSRGHETVLLAEDEEGVRHLARQVLEDYGYRVLEARNGAEALSLASSHDGPIHLLLTDVVMPAMSGAELAKRLDGLRGGIRVLFASGYAGDAVMRHGVEEGVSFLQKPFTPEELADKVREVLDR